MSMKHCRRFDKYRQIDHHPIMCRHSYHDEQQREAFFFQSNLKSLFLFCFILMRKRVVYSFLWTKNVMYDFTQRRDPNFTGVINIEFSTIQMWCGAVHVCFLWYPHWRIARNLLKTGQWLICHITYCFKLSNTVLDFTFSRKTTRHLKEFLIVRDSRSLSLIKYKLAAYVLLLFHRDILCSGKRQNCNSTIFALIVKLDSNDHHPNLW